MAGPAVAQPVPRTGNEFTDGRCTQSAPAVDKLVTILEVLAHSQQGLTLRELADRSGVPKSTVHCIRANRPACRKIRLLVAPNRRNITEFRIEVAAPTLGSTPCGP